MAKPTVKKKKAKTPTKATQPEHAVATSKKPTGTDAEKIETCDDHMSAMKQSASWGAATDVQSAATGWAATNTLLDQNVGTIEDLRTKLAAAVGVQRGLRVKWVAGRKHVIGAVNVFCGGSAALIQSFGFDELVKSPADTAITVPTDIITSPGTNPGECDVAWNEEGARHGWVLQWATDPSNPATLSQPIPCTVASFTLAAQASAATVHFRIAAIDPSLPGHVTPYSGWVAGTVH